MKAAQKDGNSAKQNTKNLELRINMDKKDDKIKKDSAKQNTDDQEQEGKDEKQMEEHEEHECKCGEEKEHLKQKVEELDNSYKRAIADYQNLQKRVSEEKSKWIRTANTDLILRILPALDHLETGLKGAKDKGEISGWLNGVEMAVKELRRVLEEEGLRPVQAEKFDPNLHEVVETREGPEGVVVDVFQMGYTLNDKLIRPAKVVVGKG